MLESDHDECVFSAGIHHTCDQQYLFFSTSIIHTDAIFQICITFCVMSPSFSNTWSLHANWIFNEISVGAARINISLL